jgi:hypothetical protein
MEMFKSTKQKVDFMTEVIIDDIPFEIDLPMLLRELRLDRNKSFINQLEHLVDQAQAIGRPKAFYKVAAIEERGDDYVVIEGIKFASRVLRVNLKGIDQVFLYAATCGVELDELASSVDGDIQNYWMNEINGLALDSAIKALDEAITNRFNPGPISSMSPGSLDDWPLEEQRKLFNLLGDLGESIGVQLLDNLWMTPAMSVSGIRFPSEDGFVSCQLCPREVCSERAAPYDETLFDRKYRLELN